MRTIAYCTTCKGRVEHLKQTLPRNLKDNPEALFVVLDYDDPGTELHGFLRDMQREVGSQLAVYQYRNGGVPFHVAHAKNMAARCAINEGAEILVTLDADNATGPRFYDFVRYQLTHPHLRANRFLCPDFEHIHTLPHGPERPLRGFAGRLAIGSSLFLALGGYDENYDTWRGEDIDFIARAKRLGFQPIYLDNRDLEAIPHNAAVRFKEYPHARKYEHRREYHIIQAQANTVVNFGAIGCGTVYRNFDFDTPMEIEPIATRVFGIGLHRTGTSSLDQAFKEFGYKSLHWGSGEAPRVWEEMQRDKRSRTLEQFYAASDLPIPLLYKQLDKAYPGSKFILTLREPEEWVESVRRLYQHETNPNRYLWDLYPFSHMIHTELYGTSRFDRHRMLEAYHRHNVDVCQYFASRLGSDFLVLDMGQSNLWEPLCEFLGELIPAEPFPHLNRSAPCP